VLLQCASSGDDQFLSEVPLSYNCDCELRIQSQWNRSISYEEYFDRCSSWRFDDCAGLCWGVLREFLLKAWLADLSLVSLRIVVLCWRAGPCIVGYCRGILWRTCLYMPVQLVDVSRHLQEVLEWFECWLWQVQLVMTSGLTLEVRRLDCHYAVLWRLARLFLSTSPLQIYPMLTGSQHFLV
jgi:hypothetical protein